MHYSKLDYSKLAQFY
jgi:hypothetical protein